VLFMDRNKRLGIIYLVFYGLMILVNYWVGQDVGAVADQNEALIQPAGYVFSIWGLIYILLFIWIIRLFFTQYHGVYERIHYWLVGNFLLNMLWIIVFTQEWLLASNIVIVALLIVTIVIYKKLVKVEAHWFDRFPFSIYMSWLSVATIVNIASWFVGNGITEFLGLDEYVWTLILLIVATVLAIVIALMHNDWVYPLVFVWSFVGIIVNAGDHLFLLIVFSSMGIVFQVIASIAAAVRKSRERAY